MLPVRGASILGVTELPEQNPVSQTLLQVSSLGWPSGECGEFHRAFRSHAEACLP